jgi:hypothetical protein
MNETPQINEAPPPMDPRRRLRELLAIPAGQRTDEQWDEINELEIRFAPGNSESRPEQQQPRRDAQPRREQDPNRRSEPGRRPDQNSAAKAGKQFPRKPKRPQGTPPKR